MAQKRTVDNGIDDFNRKEQKMQRIVKKPFIFASMVSLYFVVLLQSTELRFSRGKMEKESLQNEYNRRNKLDLVHANLYGCGLCVFWSKRYIEEDLFVGTSAKFVFRRLEKRGAAIIME